MSTASTGGGLERFQLAQAYRETAQTGVLARYWKRRWHRSAEMANWLSQEELPALSEQRALALYRASGGGKANQFIANGLADIGETMDFLLYDNITLEARFNECVAEDGAYKLPAAGKEFISYLLCLKQPALFAVYNRAAERALRCLGRYPVSMRAGHLGLRYLDLLDAAHRLRPAFGLADFREVDEFFYFLTRRGAASSPTPGRAASTVVGNSVQTNGNIAR
ncbi:MAG: hypothetical protein OXR67_09170 [Chloroflexota bacterium]|nr:hypothetical protein [Chloroflexota bacterium]